MGTDYQEWKMSIDPNERMWWGYLHQNGSIQVKRWYGDHKDYTEDCYGNDFVQQVVSPFQAETREQAEKIVSDRLRYAANRQS